MDIKWQTMSEAFGIPEEKRGVETEKVLRKLEKYMQHANQNWFDGLLEDITWEAIKNAVVRQLVELGVLMTRVEINTDPRGYAIKLKPEFTARYPHTDLGGYGFIK